MIFRSNELSTDAPQLSGAKALFLALFVAAVWTFAREQAAKEAAE